MLSGLFRHIMGRSTGDIVVWLLWTIGRKTNLSFANTVDLEDIVQYSLKPSCNIVMIKSYNSFVHFTSHNMFSICKKNDPIATIPAQF